MHSLIGRFFVFCGFFVVFAACGFAYKINERFESGYVDDAVLKHTKYITDGKTRLLAFSCSGTNLLYQYDLSTRHVRVDHSAVFAAKYDNAVRLMDKIPRDASEILTAGSALFGLTESLRELKEGKSRLSNTLIVVFAAVTGFPAGYAVGTYLVERKCGTGELFKRLTDDGNWPEIERMVFLQAFNRADKVGCLTSIGPSNKFINQAMESGGSFGEVMLRADELEKKDPETNARKALYERITYSNSKEVNVTEEDFIILSKELDECESFRP